MNAVFLRVFFVSALFLPGSCRGLFAGDILRGGTSVGSGRKPADPQASSGAQAAELAKTKAADRLARTTRIVSSMRALQESARAAGNAGTVPYGLSVGGLKVLTGSNAKWAGASTPVQSGNVVSIRQTKKQAVLHWETFDVAAGTTVDFDQTSGGADSGKWIAFNKVFDPAGKPSEIRGQIKADGQVYIINQNGILFGVGSQVNARTLVASSLPINEKLQANGLLTQTAGDIQFLFEAPQEDVVGDVKVEAGATISSPVTAEGNGGRIMLVGRNVTNAGTLSSPSGQTILAAGRQVGVIGHEKDEMGFDDPTLRGLDVYVGSVGNGGTATNSGLIEGQLGNIWIAGKSINQLGVIESSTSVSLNGRIDLDASYDAVPNPTTDATTSNEKPFLKKSTGNVTFAANSLMRILPETASAETKTGTELALRSQVNVTGRNVYLGQGSAILAPNAEMDVRAGNWGYVDSASVPTSGFVSTGGQVYVDKNTLLDVSGTTGVSAPLSQKILTVELRGTELADSPLQRTGAVRGVKITVDTRKSGSYNGSPWVGTPLGDVSGYVGLVERTVSQLTTAGGSISISAGESVIAREGSTIDVSAGWVRYEGGKVRTTRLWQNGRLVDIADATPDRVYDGVFTGTTSKTSAKWGVAKTYRISLAPTGEYTQSSYIHGADAGALSITAPAMALAGKLSGATLAGGRQLRSSGSSGDLPKAGSLTLSFRAQEFRASDPLLQRSVTLTAYPTPPRVSIDGSAVTGIAPFSTDSDGVAAALDSGHVEDFHLPPGVLADGGFGSLAVNNEDGGIVVPDDVTLTTPPAGLISLTGSNVDIQGRIVSPGGSVSLKALNISPYKSSLLSLTETPKTPKPNTGRGTVSLGPRALISVAGTFVDDRPTSQAGEPTPISINAGSVSLSGFNVRLASGSVIDASGGVTITAPGKRKFGNGGSISVLAGQDPETKSVVGGKLVLNGTLKAYSGGRLAGLDSNGNSIYPGDTRFRGYAGGAALEARGGSLSIRATRIQVGGNQDGGDVFVIRPSFFQTGGFTNYSITGLGRKAGDDAQSADDVLPPAVALSTAESLADANVLPAIEILPNTVIEPISSSFDLEGGAFKGLASVRIVTRQVGERAPTSVSFEAAGVNDFGGTLVTRGDLVMGEGSAIRTDPEAAVSLKGHTVAVLGSISAPGGTITITGSKYSKYSSSVFPEIAAADDTGPLPAADPVPLTTVYIGSRSTLSTKGTTIHYPDSYGRKAGRVLGGGTITVAGNIVAAKGAVLDVSGASATLDVLPSAAGIASSQTIGARSGLNAPRESLRTAPKVVDTDGGSINFDAGPQLLSDATLKGFAGGASADGGTLTVSAAPFQATDDELPADAVGLVIAQGGKAIAPDVPDDRTAIGSGVFAEVALAEVGAKPLKISGSGFFAADKFIGGGFDSLALSGVLSFVGPVDIPARNTIKLGDKGIIIADGAVNLSAPHVMIGSAYAPPQQTQTVADPTDANAVKASYGTGRLNISSRLIDVGNLTLRNIGKTTLAAGGGDIRGYGTLSVAGDLTLRAAQIYPATAGTFTIIASDYSADGATESGSVTIESSGTKKIPLSAGGTLRIYASNITQSGTLRAPFGSISIGWDGTGTAPRNPLTGETVSVTRQLAFGSSGITSVSAVDPKSGDGTIIPYGVSLDGSNWISPSGTDITSSGLPSKSVRISAQNLDFQGGAVVDVRGGGDLLAYRWIEGKGGSKDILSSGESFAILPGYDSGYMPYASFNGSDSDGNLISNSGSGYANPSLQVGDKVYLSGSKSLAAGYYTLLPARYAVMSGAILVTPKAGFTRATVETAEGASIVAGYRFNSLNTDKTGSPLSTKFEVVSGKTLADRAQYETLSANSFLAERASDLHQTPQILPKDSGYVLFQSTASMNLSGMVRSKSVSGGDGAYIDINTPLDIVITGTDAVLPSGTVSLNAARLTSWESESLLIGGVRDRTKSSNATTVNVQAKSITLDNVGAPLSGPEVILVASDSLALASGAEISQSGVVSSPENLALVGGRTIAADRPLAVSKGGGAISFPGGTAGGTISSTVGGTITNASGTTATISANTPFAVSAGSTLSLNAAGSISLTNGGTTDGIPVNIDDGVLLRVTSSPDTTQSRATLAFTSTPSLTIGDGAKVSAASLVLDSTSAMRFSPTASLVADAYDISSGRISLDFGGVGTRQADSGLVIGDATLLNLQNAKSIALSSYSSLDIYGSGSLGGGRLVRLTVSAGDILNRSGDSVGFSADSIFLNNGKGAPGRVWNGAADGSLTFRGKTITLGSGQVYVSGFSDVILSATGAISSVGEGGLTTQNRMVLRTPLLVGTAGSVRTLAADPSGLGPAGLPSLVVENIPKPGGLPNPGGPGATLNLSGGQGVAISSDIVLPGGAISVSAANGDVLVSGKLDVSGGSQAFHDVTKDYDAGEVRLTADKGNVILDSAGGVDVSAPGAKAGLLAVSAPGGAFVLDGSLSAAGAASGGSFSLDVKTMPALSLHASKLASFTGSQSFRVRGDSLVPGSGDVVVDGVTVTRNFSLSSDQGKITVAGTIRASGATGGSISLAANGDVELASSAILSVHGAEFNNAGKGGAINLSAGTQRNGGMGPGRVIIAAGSLLDLGVDAAPDDGQFGGTLSIRAPQNAAGSNVLVDPILGTIRGASAIMVEGYRLYDLTGSGGAITPAVQQRIKTDGETFVGTAGTNSPTYAAMSSAILAGTPSLAPRVVFLPGAEVINRAVASPLNFSFTAPGSSLVVNPESGGGGGVTFPGGTPGNNLIRTNTAATITSATGAVTALAANTPTSLPAGSTVHFVGQGTIAFVGGSGGVMPVTLSPGASYTQSAAGASGTVSAVGSVVTLNTAGSGSISLAAGTKVTLPNGTSGTNTTNRIRSSVAGTITSPTGAVTVLAANTNTQVAEGSTIALNAAGTLTFSSGTGGAIQVALASGSFTTAGSTGLAPSTGNLVLGSISSASASDWDLSGYRFGANKSPGALTLRAAGDLVFYNTLSDGFSPVASNLAANGFSSMWLAGVMDSNPSLPANAQSWSFDLASGADLSAAEASRVQAAAELASLQGGRGSLRLGKNIATPSAAGGGNAQTAALIGTATLSNYQVIRTGTGDIRVSAGVDVRLLNPFASIYTAGVKVADATIGGEFDVPQLLGDVAGGALGKRQQTYAAQYTQAGGDVDVSARRDASRLTQVSATNTTLVADSTKELPTSWLYRRSHIDGESQAFGAGYSDDPDVTRIDSTTWWVDFSNFFEGIGTLGGGNISLIAGGNINNVDAAAPTNARIMKGAAATAKLVELGGGDVFVRAGGDINGGVYYVERGRGTLAAGRGITTNATRGAATNSDPKTWLPTTLFLGKGGFDVTARGNILLGPAANPFLLPGGIGNAYYYKSYFSTYSADATVDANSIGGSVTWRTSAAFPTSGTGDSAGVGSGRPLLLNWYEKVLLLNSTAASNTQPWLRLNEKDPFNASLLTAFGSSGEYLFGSTSLQPATLKLASFSSDINLQGDILLAPSAGGTLELLASGSVNGLQPNGKVTVDGAATTTWGASVITLSDADPSAVPSIRSSISYRAIAGSKTGDLQKTGTTFLDSFKMLFAESGATSRATDSDETTLQKKNARHASSILHAADASPVRIYAGGGDISGFTLFSPKFARVIAWRDVSDIALYLQNADPGDASVISSGRDLTPFNDRSLLRVSARLAGNVLNSGSTFSGHPGDIQISGGGSLEVLAGGTLDLGTGTATNLKWKITSDDGLKVAYVDATSQKQARIKAREVRDSKGGLVNPWITSTSTIALLSKSDGTGTGITSVGNARNPYLPFEGADLIIGAGLGAVGALSANSLDFTAFITGLPGAESSSPQSASLLREVAALEQFYTILRDAGRDHSDPTNPNHLKFAAYAPGYAAIDTLFPDAQAKGDILTRSRDIRTKNGGGISVFAPGGGLTMSGTSVVESETPPGIITETGGAISIFTDRSVDIGIGRIFTLRGGDILIWSSKGDIAAGASSKTVRSAPPTRVLLDPQSAALQADLAGLATGGGIGVLATVKNVAPGDVDLIAPVGTVDAGDAGIRATGNLNIAASRVLNADNISVGGTKTGVPSAPTVATPNIGGLTSGSTAAAAASTAAQSVSNTTERPPEPEMPSVITVEVLGYGGGEDDG
ncbi:MAG: filamentous hemagglutinin family protein [Terrimicrobiaceae bacterium]